MSERPPPYLSIGGVLHDCMLYLLHLRFDLLAEKDFRFFGKALLPGSRANLPREVPDSRPETEQGHAQVAPYVQHLAYGGLLEQRQAPQQVTRQPRVAPHSR